MKKLESTPSTSTLEVPTVRVGFYEGGYQYDLYEVIRVEEEMMLSGIMKELERAVRYRKSQVGYWATIMDEDRTIHIKDDGFYAILNDGLVEWLPISKDSKDHELTFVIRF